MSWENKNAGQPVAAPVGGSRFGLNQQTPPPYQPGALGGGLNSSRHLTPAELNDVRSNLGLGAGFGRDTGLSAGLGAGQGGLPGNSAGFALTSNPASPAYPRTGAGLTGGIGGSGSAGIKAHPELEWMRLNKMETAQRIFPAEVFESYTRPEVLEAKFKAVGEQEKKLVSLV